MDFSSPTQWGTGGVGQCVGHYAGVALRVVALWCVLLYMLLGLGFEQAVAQGLSQGSEPPAGQSRIVTLQVQSDDSGVYVDAQVDLVLPEAMHEALDKGMALHFVARAQVSRERWYWFDAQDAQVSKTVRLSYQPLMQRYRVTVGGLSQSFNTLPEALGLLGHISHWRVTDAQVLAYSGRKKLIFTFELDRSLLPRPFQISVANQQEWRLRLSQEVDLEVPQAEMK